mgnify:CR=1 FL=1
MTTTLMDDESGEELDIAADDRRTGKHCEFWIHRCNHADGWGACTKHRSNEVLKQSTCHCRSFQRTR